MNSESLRAFIRPDQFHPFDLKLAKGDVHRVTDPYQMAVTKIRLSFCLWTQACGTTALRTKLRASNEY